MTQVPRDEVAAAVAARRELGTDYEDAVVQSLSDKIDAEIERRVQQRLAVREPERPQAHAQGPPRMSIGLALGSIVLAIPLTAITLVAGHSMALAIVVWVAIVIINVAVNRHAR